MIKNIMEKLRGYKYTDKDGFGFDLKYEVGKTYILDGELIPRFQGFHFSKRLDDLFIFEVLESGIRIFEVEASDIIIKISDEEYITNNIKILKELGKDDINSISKIYKYEDDILIKTVYDGEIIHFKDGNQIYKKNVYGEELNHEYNDINNLPYEKKTYDNDNNLVSREVIDNNVNTLYLYDDNKLSSVSVSTNNRKRIDNYDTNGNLINSWEYIYDNSGNYIYVREEVWVYNKYGDMIYYNMVIRDDKEYVREISRDWVYTYDDNDNLIYYKSYDGDEFHITYEYDDNNNIVYMVDENGFEYWFDGDGNCIERKTSNEAKFLPLFLTKNKKIFNKTYKIKIIE